MPPPGAGFMAVIMTVFALVRLVAGTIAVSWSPLTSVVDRGAPFQLTTAPGTKLNPFTVNMKLEAPGATADGTSGCEMPGSAFVSGFDPVPPKTTRYGLSRSVVSICTCADRGPVALGANVTSIVQLSPDFRMLPQLLVCANSALS